MTTPIPYLLQGKNIILVIDGKSHTISKDTHIAYGKIVECLKKQDWDSLRECVTPSKAIIDFGKGHVGISGNKITWKGKEFNNALTQRMIEMYQDGFPIDPMVRFMEKLMTNPSKRSVDQVYGFLEKNKLPITSDGFFLAFKRVNSDYLDVHSNTIDNSIGQVVEMDRNLVDDNPDSHCSTGLHFCSESYLGHFGIKGDPVMILKISPADVVSIPTDYNGAKGRCCKYEVVAEVQGDAGQAFTKAVIGDYSPAQAAVKPVKKPAFKAPAAYTGDPAAAWPFPIGANQFDTEVEDDALYSVERVYSGAVEGWDLTKAEAEEMVAKNVRQKKAQLKIVKQED